MCLEKVNVMMCSLNVERYLGRHIYLNE